MPTLNCPRQIIPVTTMTGMKISRETVGKLLLLTVEMVVAAEHAVLGRVEMRVVEVDTEGGGEGRAMQRDKYKQANL